MKITLEEYINQRIQDGKRMLEQSKDWPEAIQVFTREVELLQNVLDSWHNRL